MLSTQSHLQCHYTAKRDLLFLCMKILTYDARGAQHPAKKELQLHFKYANPVGKMYTHIKTPLFCLHQTVDLNNLPKI